MKQELHEIYKKYGSDLYAFILRMCRSEQLARDILQDTMLKAMQSADSFKGDCSVKTWLYKGSAAKCNAEFNWIIDSIEYPDGYVPEDEEKIRGLIKEAFIVESYSELFNHERVKNVSVRFEC